MIINWRLIKELAGNGMEIDKSVLDLVKHWEDIVTWADELGMTELNCQEAYKAVMETNPVRNLTHIFVLMRQHMMGALQ